MPFKYKTFTGKTLNEALMKMKLEMGPEVLLVSQREVVGGGVLGLFKSRRFEVTGALSVPQAKPGSAPGVRSQALETISKVSSVLAAGGSSEGDRPKEAKNLYYGPKKPYGDRPITYGRPAPMSPPRGAEKERDEPPSESRDGEGSSHYKSLHQELHEIKVMMSSMAGARKEELTDDVPNRDYPNLRDMCNLLLEADVDRDLASRIVKNLSREISEKDLENREVVKDRLTKHIERMIKTSGPLVLDGRRKLIALVGPTGVGKTTTIAKLAANYRLVEKKRVGLITVDTYRIAAVDQLRTYGEIIGLPVEVALSPQEFERLIANTVGKDLVFIDTAGRNQKNDSQMTDLMNYLRQSPEVETYLVLSATTKSKDALNILESFKKISFSKIIFTKLDETTTYGTILNVMERVDQPLCYVTMGQNVPDDIEVADAEKLAKNIMGHKTYRLW